MSKLFTLLLVVAFVLVMVAPATPAKAAGDDSNCCASPSAIYCYACAPLSTPQSTADQVTPGIDAASYYQLRGQIASNELGLIVNITDYGRYTLRDPNSNLFVNGTPTQRIAVSAITTNGLNIK